MQTRRDHLQAYQFATGRLSSALVSGDPGRGESPLKRTALGTFLGACVVVLLCAGFGIYGLVSPGGNTSWRTAGTVVVEKETGTRYLYTGGKLRPLRNWASALLIAGKGAPVTSVSRNSLGATPHGAPVGIDGAPDSLPAAAGLLNGPWTRCLRPGVGDGQVVDFAPDGTAAVPAGRQVLLSGPGGKRYLLWRGVPYPVPSLSVLVALGLDGDRAVAAPADWLASLRSGTPLTAPVISGAGRPAGKVAGRPARVGDLFTTAVAGGVHHYVLTAHGFTPVGATAAALLAAKPGATPALRVSAQDLAAVPEAASGLPADPLPDVLDAPQAALGQRAVCLLQRSQGAKLTTRVVLEGGAAATGRSPVLVPALHGLVAVDRDQELAQRSSPAAYLITDQGIAYRVDDQASGQALGLGSAPATALPAGLLHDLPHGPDLGIGAARATVGGS
ncbi:type VII secretion protein EccB [Streptomyces sp. SL13]|uniref:Type VII secretion protein EccB n=1 Tax=Streptantibioticus silvisoli TaxID=2705255 RepID=A0AA90HDF0_9ACTN|nr:type VII secretion protein EccB [Streptantibioticus silvisoli]MDI5972862.1 type VII secretion protein EccB [Streptantibioticus silvisoli]